MFQNTIYSAIHKATSLMVHGCSTGLPGIIPKISKEAAVQNALQRLFCMVAGCTAALWIGWSWEHQIQIQIFLSDSDLDTSDN